MNIKLHPKAEEDLEKALKHYFIIIKDWIYIYLPILGDLKRKLYWII